MPVSGRRATTTVRPFGPARVRLFVLGIPKGVKGVVLAKNSACMEASDRPTDEELAKMAQDARDAAVQEVAPSIPPMGGGWGAAGTKSIRDTRPVLSEHISSWLFLVVQYVGLG